MPVPGGGGMPPLPTISWATVGHEQPEDEVPDITAAYWFMRGGQAYVECTIQPGGGQVVARVNMDGCYEPLSFGDRVCLLHIGGDPNASLVMGKVHDDSDPMPETVAGMPMSGVVIDPADSTRTSSRVQFIRPKPDCVLAVETTGTGDILIHSEAGVSIKAGAAGFVHIDGQQVVLGQGPATPPVPGQMVGEEETPAVPFVPYGGAPTGYATNPPYAGLLDAIVRAGDAMQSTPGLDPAFFAYVTAVDVFLKAIAAVPAISAALVAALAAYQVAVPTPPTAIKSRAMTACQHVEARG